jgi:hypothetical protein
MHVQSSLLRKMTDVHMSVTSVCLVEFGYSMADICNHNSTVQRDVQQTATQHGYRYLLLILGLSDVESE